MEVLGCYTALCGGSQEQILQLCDCATTEEAFSMLIYWGLCQPVMEKVMERITAQIDRKLMGELPFEVMVYTNRHGLVGQTAGAEALLQEISLNNKGDLP